MTWRTWTRVGFREPGAYEVAIAEIARLEPKVHQVAAGLRTSSSVWSVDSLNHPVSATVSWGQQVPTGRLNLDEERCSYLYFSPGAAEALHDLLPDNWVHDPCEPPPAHLAVPVFGADDDSHFGSD